MTSKASGVLARRSFPLSPVAHRKLKILSNKMIFLPEQQTAFDLQIPLNKLMVWKSQCEYLSGESIFPQGYPSNAVFYIQSCKV
jgi:hypothetical protein